MADPLNNLRAAYHELADKVYAALHTQVGNAARLRLQQREVLLFFQDASVVDIKHHRMRAKY